MFLGVLEKGFYGRERKRQSGGWPSENSDLRAPLRNFLGEKLKARLRAKKKTQTSGLPLQYFLVSFAFRASMHFDSKDQ